MHQMHPSRMEINLCIEAIHSYRSWLCQICWDPFFLPLQLSDGWDFGVTRQDVANGCQLTFCNARRRPPTNFNPSTPLAVFSCKLSLSVQVLNELNICVWANLWSQDNSWKHASSYGVFSKLSLPSLPLLKFFRAKFLERELRKKMRAQE